jgi:hypothetical protein
MTGSSEQLLAWARACPASREASARARMDLGAILPWRRRLGFACGASNRSSVLGGHGVDCGDARRRVHSRPTACTASQPRTLPPLVAHILTAVPHQSHTPAPLRSPCALLHRAALTCTNPAARSRGHEHSTSCRAPPCRRPLAPCSSTRHPILHHTTQSYRALASRRSGGLAGQELHDRAVACSRGEVPRRLARLRAPTRAPTHIRTRPLNTHEPPCGYMGWSSCPAGPVCRAS